MKRYAQAIRSMSFVGALCLLSCGAATHGAGLDVLVPIDGPFEVFIPYSHLIWEQPPLEWDATSKTAFFCGWDEPAYDEDIPKATAGSSNEPADDFRCLGSMPVTSIHWWGSYKDWQESTAPDVGPDAWRITISANIPADAYNPFSRPGIQLRQFEVSPDRVQMQPVGFDRFPKEPEDSCFKYSLTLDSTEYFWPDLYEGDVFWIGISALYRTQTPDHRWGWKTRPWTWMGGAVKIATAWNMTPQGLPISAAVILPVTKDDACGNPSPYDMAFALDTDPVWVKWEQPFTGLRDWSHYEDEPSTATGLSASSIALKCRQPPDLGRTGMGVDATVDTPKTLAAQVLADDYKCTLTGPVTGIDLWGSFYADTLPAGDPGNLEFTLGIRADIPAPSRTSYSMPGKVLWTRTFKKGQFTVQEEPAASETQYYYSPCSREHWPYSHKRAFKYSFTINPSEAFVQTGSTTNPVVYWLSVQAKISHLPPTTIRFGWKTSATTWGDDAVWAQAEEPYAGTWQKLGYPFDHLRYGQPIALAFAITTSDQSTTEEIDRQVADDWKCEQSSPVVAATWWGSYRGYIAHPCQCGTLPEPVRPDYFLLAIWSDVPQSNSTDPQGFSHPGDKLWWYKAYQYDEVAVGTDKQPEDPSADEGRDVVYRYSVQLPTESRFTETQAGSVYWFSVVAVYIYPKVANYAWGWTNHEHVFGDDAVSNTPVHIVPVDVSVAAVNDIGTWQPLEDQTGASEDMSFMLFQQAQILGPPPIAVLAPDAQNP
jgi:hypothetical protein